MLPTNGWLPATGDARFEPVSLPVPPGSIVAVYRDFSLLDPHGATQPILLTLKAQGAGNTAIGEAGVDAATEIAAVVTLMQGNVYGCVLVDTLTLLNPRGWIDGRGGRPDSFFAPGDCMARPATPWTDCPPARPDSDWSAV